MSIKRRTESGIYQNRTELPVGDWGPVIPVLVLAERGSSKPGLPRHQPGGHKVQAGTMTSGFEQVERKSKIKDKKSKLQVKKQKFSALASRGSQ